MLTQIGIAKRALNDAKECGDACHYWQLDGKIVLCMVDGLGHGIAAEHAAVTAIDCVAANLTKPLGVIFERCDTALTGTRGAAMSVAIVDQVTGSLNYAGIGNANIIFGKAGGKRLPNRAGIVGAGFSSFAVENARLARGDLVLMYTDGLKTRIDLMGYDQALMTDPRMLASRVLSDWRRGTDDAAVLAFRYGGGR